MSETTINDAPTIRDEAAGNAGRLRSGDEILGRYVVESELGQGGMGVVYKCLDRVGRVEVAVKGLPPEVSHNADEMELFAGRLPFDGDDLTVLCQAVLNAPAPKIPTASSVVNAALAKALAKKPEDRFSSCAAFVAAFAGKVRVVPKRPVGNAIAVASLLVFLAGGGLVYKHQVDRQEVARVAKVAADEKAKAEEEKRQAEEKSAREKAEAEAKRLADEKTAREKAEAEAKQPKPQSVDETEVQQKIAELRRLRTLIDIKRTGLREAVEKVAPYRDDADGFAAHLAAVDAAVKGLENAKEPADVSGAKALAERLQSAADTVAVELKWLETNRAARDKAKAIDGEIVSLDPELMRVKAEEVVPARLAEGRQLQTEARKLLADGAFESAAQTFGGAKAKLVETVAAAKAFQLKLALDEGRTYAGAAQWEKALAAAERALAWEAASEDARKLKSEAESHLSPSLKFVVKVEGREVEGAQVTIDGKIYTSPVELKKLEKGSRLASLSASYEAAGKRYRQTFAAIDVDWIGPKTLALALPEVKEPMAGTVKEIELSGGVKMKFVWCPPGSFTMGSPTDEDELGDDETQHPVTLTKGFWMGQYEVTQAQWRSVMGDNPSNFRGDDDRPVERVSWEDCQKFVEKCNAVVKNVRFVLPTEAQWEYACRAGSTGPFAGTGDLAEMGWCSYNGGEKTHPVGQKKPNAWNLYDMHGNVCEWCADWYGTYEGDSTDPTGPASGESRVLRGGGWDNGPRDSRSASRNWFRPGCRYYDLGFRLLCSAGPHK